MNEPERKEFDSLIMSAMKHGKGQQLRPQELKSRLDFYWKTLNDLSLKQVGTGLGKHFRISKWTPEPSEIRAQLYTRDTPAASTAPQLPAADPQRMSGPEVDVRQRLMTLNEYLALSDAELQVLGQSRQSVNTFKEWLE